MKDIKILLNDYKNSKAFAEDCRSMKSELVLKEREIPCDLNIEQMVLKDKEEALMLEEECAVNGHDLAIGEEEEIDGELWTYCQRCGEYFEIQDDEERG